MPRKLFRKILPSHETIRENRYIARFGPRLQHHNLWHLHRRSVAGGVAVGLFCGLVPGSNPVQFIAAALVAIALKVNLPIAVAVTLYTNPFTIVPLYYLAFRVGEFVLVRGTADIPSIDLAIQGKRFYEWLPAIWDWITHVGKPLLVGLPTLAATLALVGYFAVEWAWRIHVRVAWRRRQLRRQAAR